MMLAPRLNQVNFHHVVTRNSNVFNIKRLFCQQQQPCDRLIDAPGDLADAYVPREIERRPLEKWFFEPALRAPRETFTMLLPPPNITGTLHLGHALTVTIQDIMVKWRRLNGIDTRWIPGTDHAGIATQVIVEKRIWAESRRTRHDLGRDAFEREVWRWKTEKSNVIDAQLRRLGASLNWERAFFTKDARQSRAVVEAFERLHADGLIYEADALVNWSCGLQSAISDIEVEHVEIAGPTQLALPGKNRRVQFGQLIEFAYKLHEHHEEEEILVATTRPETILGDVALAVHPEDARYTHLIGRRVVHPFSKELLPIIADASVQRDFGTGVVKITPAHDHADWDVARRHALSSRTIFDERGCVINCGLGFDGMDRFDARAKVLSALDVRAVRDHAMAVPLCSRTGDVVELLMKPQWFVDCRRMAACALEAVESGRIRLEPQQFVKVWRTWLENIRPWCISRQLWWGHRIPAYRCKDADGKIVSTIIAPSREEAIRRGGADGDVTQVDDVLDTWFSSALLPLSAVDVEGNGDAREPPLDVLETGHDIIFFWVARMAMLCTHLSRDGCTPPFRRVLLHGVLCDAHGRKMSKSLGNVIAPEDVVEGRTLKDLEAATSAARNQGVLSADEAQRALKGQRKMFPDGIHACGVDALRFTLASHNFKNHLVNFDVQECKTNQFFGNKLWQATKFTLKWRAALMAVAESHESKAALDGTMDKWILSRLNFMLAEVNEALSGDNFHVAAAALKNFLYYEFCDVYLESTKRGLRDDGDVMHVRVLEHCLLVALRALAPFMPHLSQHLYAHLAHAGAVVDADAFANRYTRDASLERQVAKLMDVVISIRRLKKIFNVTAKHQPKVMLVGADEFLRSNRTTIMDLAACALVEFDSQRPGGCYVSDLPQQQQQQQQQQHSVETHLFVPEELRAALTIDGEKLAARRAKLDAELAKLRADERPSAKVSARLAQLEEKITRLDYVRSLYEDRNATCRSAQS